MVGGGRGFMQYCFMHSNPNQSLEINFFRNQDIAENIYTVPEVIAESCDRATRRRLKTFPLDIKFKEPSGDAILKGIMLKTVKKKG